MPRSIPDLYAGGQLVLLGRYTGAGDVALRLTGRVNDASETFTYEAAFPAEGKANAFIEPLWAKRRVGVLLDQIRLHGESKELVDDVIRLSKEYGIQTPYTSYLILEDSAPLSRGGEELERRRALEAKLGAAAPTKPPAAPSPEETADRAEREAAAKSVASGFRKKDGKDAVEAATYLRKLKESDKDEGGGRVPIKRAGGRTFFEIRGLWVDGGFEASDATTSVKFGSAAYFRILELRPELAEFLKVSSEMVLRTAKGKALVITTSSGAETLSDERISGLFTEVSK
jgi:Ca-activated chloride channel family protein